MAIEKYLAKYAESECGHLQNLMDNLPDGNNRWQFVLVIPAYNEDPGFFDLLSQTLLATQPVLLILVVNQPESISIPTVRNSQLCKHLFDHTRKIAACGHLSLLQFPHNDSSVLLVQRYGGGRGIPDKQGVGLARKIGADLAAMLVSQSQIACEWIFTTDADCRLPENYFVGIQSANNAAAVTYPFYHLTGEDLLGQATRLYELSLYHYLQGLRSAGSPYAFQSIGSTIAVNVSHYCQVRGFPKRAGGEDFYLLNKLAKTGNIQELELPAICIQARHSDRVPFGTGPAVARIMRMQNPAREFRCYNPEIFGQLQQWLTAMPGLINSHLESLPLPIFARNILTQMGVERAQRHARLHGKSVAAFTRHMHNWFDGFRTLKFVRALEKAVYPPVAIADLYPIQGKAPCHSSARLSDSGSC